MNSDEISTIDKTRILFKIVQGVNSEIDLQSGMIVRLTTDESFENKSTVDNLYVDYKNIVNVMKSGNRIYIDDGLISLLVKHCGS